MLEEVQAFAQVLKGGQELYSDYLQAAATVHECMFAMRKDAGIRFEVDHD